MIGLLVVILVILVLAVAVVVVVAVALLLHFGQPVHQVVGRLKHELKRFGTILTIEFRHKPSILYIHTW